MIAICHRCEHRQNPCHGKCTCTVDGADILRHVADGACPLGRFDGFEPERATSGGPGTELARLLAWWGIEAEGSCKCMARAAEMDRRGADWCEANNVTVIGWLEEESRRRGIFFPRVLAYGAVTLAISRARKRGAERPS